MLIKAAAAFFAGWGLLRRAPWARMLTIVLSFLAWFHIPLGTARHLQPLGFAAGAVRTGIRTSGTECRSGLSLFFEKRVYDRRVCIAGNH